MLSWVPCRAEGKEKQSSCKGAKQRNSVKLRARALLTTAAPRGARPPISSPHELRLL